MRTQFTITVETDFDPVTVESGPVRLAVEGRIDEVFQFASYGRKDRPFVQNVKLADVKVVDATYGPGVGR